MSAHAGVTRDPSRLTHRDIVARIGGTFGTGRTRRERRWNQYYFRSYALAMRRLIGTHRGGTLMDVGTSSGFWLPFWRQRGFDVCLGVELDPERAKAADSLGYDAVYPCDAVQIPHPSDSVDVVVSNDVFVHILRRDDKIAVLKELERVVKPGGMVIVNHPMASAFGLDGFAVQGECSFFSLGEFIDLFIRQTRLRIEDVTPTYFHFRNTKPSALRRLLKIGIEAPFAVDLLCLLDCFHARELPLAQSDTVYIKAAKPHG